MKFIIINKKLLAQSSIVKETNSINKNKKSKKINSIHLVSLMFNLTLLMSNWMQFSPIQEESE